MTLASVRAHQRVRLAGPDDEVHAAKDLYVAVLHAGVKVPDLKQILGHLMLQ